MEFKLGELFCGPGGMALGARLATAQSSLKGEGFSIKHVWGVDRDPQAIETYNANDLGEGVQCDALDFSRNCEGCDHKVIGDFPFINALAFGFPCNDFSMVGKRKGTDGAFGNLYKAGVNAINYSNPTWFIAENVSGIHSANAGQAFQKILSELSDSGKGYDLTVNLYKFEDYGIPQYRHRYIIVGIRKDLGLTFRIPAPSHRDNHVTAEQALTKPYEDKTTGRELTNQHERIVERLRFTPPWENAWYLDTMLEKMTKGARRDILENLPWRHEFFGVSDYMIEKRIGLCRLHCTKARMSHIYRRLHPNKPSYTITGSGGGGTHVYHWEEHRALTNRERARLQGFPDDFEFIGKKEQVRKQIGMAVPPQGAKIIFEAILKTFAGIEYDWIEPTYSFKENL
jgi:DNA (cytosine-5)-methyltransferase 1